MSTALVAARRPSALDALMTPDGWTRFKDISAILAAGGNSPDGRMIPKCFKNVQEVQAGLLLGLSLGYDLLGAIAFLQHLHPVEGKLVPGWEWKLARVTSMIPTFRWGITHLDDTKCTAWFQRAPDHEKFVVTYTKEQAEKAGLVKDKSGWDRHLQSMLRKTVVVQGSMIVGADALVGVPPDRDLEDLDEAVEHPASSVEVLPDPEKVAMRVLVAPAAEPVVDVAPADVVDSPQVGSAKEVFYAEVEKRGWNVKHGPTIYRLLQELLSEGGQKPVWKGIGEIPTNDWRIAFLRLCERYPNGKPATGGSVVDTPASAPEGKPSDPAPAGPAAEAPPDPTEQLREDGAAAEDEQMKDRVFLLQLGLELERAWKAKPNTVISETSAGSWFVARDILVELGFKTDDGKPTAMALFDSKEHPGRNLTPTQTYALSSAVKRLLRDLAR